MSYPYRFVEVGSWGAGKTRKAVGGVIHRSQLVVRRVGGPQSDVPGVRENKRKQKTRGKGKKKQKTGDELGEKLAGS